MTQIVVEVPQGLETLFELRVSRLIEELADEAAQQDELRRVEVDDQAMLDWLDRACMGANNRDFPPVVRASTYRTVGCHQEIRGTRVLGEARPVLMRGSKEVMEANYTTKSAIGKVIAKRYLRRIKFTALTCEPCHEINDFLRRRLEQNGWYVHDGNFLGCHWPGDSRYFGPGKIGIWLGGEWIDITAERYAQLLDEAKKTREAAEVRRSIKKESSERKWREAMNTRRDRDEVKDAERAKKREKREADRRKRRATEIAAYEVLTEMGIIEQENANA